MDEYVGMEFQDVLDRRRMVRGYTNDPIDPEALERIVVAGVRAPSAGFSQGQSFVVVTDPERRSRIAELAGEPTYLEAGFDPWISRAQALVVLCTSENRYRERYGEPDKTRHHDGTWPVPWWWVDAGAAMQNVLLAAVDEGLAAGFLGIQAIDGLADLLGIPDDVSPVGVITIGHPAPDRRSGSLDRGRRETVHWEQW